MDSDGLTLSQRFTNEMYQGAETLAAHWDPRVFRRMLDTHGGVETARRLVLAPPSSGLLRLRELGLLDMSVEMWVLLPRYEPLFTPEVRESARRKLTAMEFDVDAELRRLEV